MKSWAIYIAAALGFAIYGASTSADRDSSGAIVDGGTVGAFDVKVGDCFNDVDYDNEITSLPAVPCSEPHDNETFAVFDLGSGISEFPDESTMSEMAYGACLERFEQFVGKDYASSSLEISTMYPTSQSWAQDDREIVCAVYDIEANKLVGSAKGRGL